MSSCHQPHVTDFREPFREEAQETKDPDLGCVSKDGGDQGCAVFCSAHISSCSLSTAIRSPHGLMWVGGKLRVSVSGVYSCGRQPLRKWDGTCGH